jgi:CheY-like chemotaxis protein
MARVEDHVMNTERMVRVVIAEDSQVDAELATRAIRKHGISVEVDVACTEDEFRAALLARAPDVIISDYSMLTMDGKAAFFIARELAPGVPFIFLSGSVLRLAAGSEHVEGAAACLDKSNLDALGEAVEKALRGRRSPD